MWGLGPVYETPAGILKRYADCLTEEQKQPGKRVFLNFNVKAKKYIQNKGENSVRDIPRRAYNWLKDQGQIAKDDTRKITGHSLRHTMATLLADQGASELELCFAGGWKSTTVAKGYASKSRHMRVRTADMISGGNGDVDVQVAKRMAPASPEALRCDSPLPDDTSTPSPAPSAPVAMSTAIVPHQPPPPGVVCPHPVSAYPPPPGSAAVCLPGQATPAPTWPLPCASPCPALPASTSYDNCGNTYTVHHHHHYQHPAPQGFPGACV